MVVCLACCGDCGDCGGGGGGDGDGNLTTTKGTSQIADLSSPVSHSSSLTHTHTHTPCPAASDSDDGRAAVITHAGPALWGVPGAAAVRPREEDKLSVATELLWSSHRDPGQDLRHALGCGHGIITLAGRSPAASPVTRKKIYSEIEFIKI